MAQGKEIEQVIAVGPCPPQWPTKLLLASSGSLDVNYKPNPKTIPKPKKKAKKQGRRLKDPVEVDVVVKGLLQNVNKDSIKFNKDGIVLPK